MSLRSALTAVSALLTVANAHVIMESPVPFSQDKVDSGPISAANFPCQSNIGFTVTKLNTMAVGEKQTLSFKGPGAPHGGGSCQLSVTTDPEPNADSKFKVIKSIEGGCPGVDQVTTFDFEIPDSVPNGKATFAWTWFAKMSGRPEMYMNCAPIEVTGGASDSSAFDELPDMFVANIESTTCKTGSNQNKGPIFPNPGQVLENGGDDAIEAPQGECGASGNTPPAEPPAEGAPSSAVEQPTEPTPTPPAEQPAEPTPTPPAGTPTNPGGVFAPSASSALPATSFQTTLVTVTAAPSAPAAGPTQPAGTGAPPQPSTPSTPGGGGSSSCSENGAVVCNGPDQFGLCNNGQVVWQAVAVGTTCTDGVIQKRGYNGRIARPRSY